MRYIRLFQIIYTTAEYEKSITFHLLHVQPLNGPELPYTVLAAAQESKSPHSMYVSLSTLGSHQLFLLRSGLVLAHVLITRRSQTQEIMDALKPL